MTSHHRPARRSERTQPRSSAAHIRLDADSSWLDSCEIVGKFSTKPLARNSAETLEYPLSYMVTMTSGIIERVERVALLRQPALPGEPRSEPILRARLCDIEAIRSWASAAEAKIVSELAGVVVMPEASIAEATRSSINVASKTTERATTLNNASGFDEALVAGSIVTGHVDELTKAAKKLDDQTQRTNCSNGPRRCWPMRRAQQSNSSAQHSPAR
jgi:hypothetical protein